MRTDNAVPIDRGRAQSGAAAQVRCHGHEHFRLLHAKIFGRRAGHQVQHRDRLSRRWEIDLGIERGELHCRNLTISTYFAREPFLTWHKKGFVRPILQTGKKRHPLVPDVPSIYELMDELQNAGGDPASW